jgi:hypothetical protein
MSVQNIKRKQQEQASRAKPMPPGFEELLQFANCLPPDTQLPSSWNLIASFSQERPLPNPVKRFKEFIEGFPRSEFPQFRAVMDKADNPTSQYTHIRAIRATLRAIARMESKAPGDFVPASGINRFVYLRVNESGQIEIKVNRLLERLQGIEAERIRECKVCHAIFWAGRIDQKACSTKHAKVLRTREWREKYLEQYKLQRVNKPERTPQRRK